MQETRARWWRWGLPGAVAVAALAAGVLVGKPAAGASDAATGSDEDFSVHVTRIENPESRFLRSNISSGTAAGDHADMYFYKVRDNKNGRILYFMYYQGNMLAPLYTTGS